MQNDYDSRQYNRRIHTAGQAADKIRFCCSIFGLRFGNNLLDVIGNAIAFVIALQASAMITNGLDKKPFDAAQFYIIMIFIVVTIILSYIKGQFVASYEEQLGVVDTAARYVHAHYQN